MIIKASSDIREDSGIDSMMHDFKLGRIFREKDYGNNSIELCFVLNCFESINVIKNRIRFSKVEQVLYWDVILDYEKVKVADMAEKKRLIATEVIKSFDVIDKYPKLGLDKKRMKEDAGKYYEEMGWL